MIFLVGMGLSVAQFIMIRDFVTVLYGEEVVIVLVTAAFFTGLSAGYLLSLRLSTEAFHRLFILSVFVHISFPFSYRYLASWISTFDVGGYAYLLFLFAYAFVFSAIFAAFLPRLIEDKTTGESKATRLKQFYSLELLGFLAGFVLVAHSWNKPLVYLLPFYWAILGVLLYITLAARNLTIIYLCTAIAAVFLLNQLDTHSTALLYKHKHGYEKPTTLFSVNSPYQKVEVIRDRRGTKHLYLDGLENLNSSDLEALNYYIATLPAVLMRPDNTLIIGNGTLSSVPKVSPLSRRVTSVELDPAVLKAGKEFFTSPGSLSGLKGWQLHIDDGKHFLRTTDEIYDLIIMDVPSPLTIQEAHLHTVEFYELVRSRLSKRGAISVQLSGKLRRNNRTSARVVAALREVFKDVIVVHSQRADRGFAYASMDLPFAGQAILAQARSYDSRTRVIEPGKVDGYLTRAIPLSIDNMDLVLRRGWERFVDRYFVDD